MSDLPHSFAGYITTQETQFKAAISESTMQKIGQCINALADSTNFQKVSFTTPGSFTWTVPSAVTSIIVEGVGGGGGGANAGGGTGGGGGAGCMKQTYYISGLTPGSSIPVVIGAAGVVGGGDGGDTLFNGNVICFGAPAAESGLGTGPVGGIPRGPFQTAGGSVSGSGAKGQDSGNFVGGSGGSSNAGGGGGASSYGDGGAGGISTVGSSPGSTAYGAGGGGGGGSGAIGANGMSGALFIYYNLLS